jgi:hypothetical protein
VTAKFIFTIGSQTEVRMARFSLVPPAYDKTFYWQWDAPFDLGFALFIVHSQ